MLVEQTFAHVCWIFWFILKYFGKQYLTSCLWARQSTLLCMYRKTGLLVLETNQAYAFFYQISED